MSFIAFYPLLLVLIYITSIYAQNLTEISEKDYFKTLFFMELFFTASLAFIFLLTSSYYANQENIIYGYKLNDKLVKYLETIFNKNLKENSFNKQKLKQVATKIKKILLRNEIDRVVIFTNANIREIFYNILKLYIDNTIVLAYEEIDDNFNVCIIDEI